MYKSEKGDNSARYSQNFTKKIRSSTPRAQSGYVSNIMILADLNFILIASITRVDTRKI